MIFLPLSVMLPIAELVIALSVMLSIARSVLELSIMLPTVVKSIIAVGNVTDNTAYSCYLFAYHIILLQVLLFPRFSMAPTA